MANGAMDRRYALASQQMRRQEQQQSEKEKEALRRRFAAQGGLGSGASIKAEQVAGQESAKRLGQAESQLEMSRLGEQARQEEIEQARAFQAGESQKGRLFAGEQSQLGRDFAGSQSQLTRDFQGEQSQLTRDFQGEQSQLGRDFAGSQSQLGRDFASEQNRMNRNLQQQGIDLQKQEFEINKLVSLFNMKGDTAAQVRDLFANMLGIKPSESSKVGSGISGSGPIGWNVKNWFNEDGSAKN
jgi:hypothetical protein